MLSKKVIFTGLAGLLSAILVTATLASAADLSQAADQLPADDEWAIMAHAAMGQNVGRSFLSQPLNSDTATDYEKRILAITAMGENPSSLSSENFVAKLESMFDGSQIGDPSLLNDDIFGALAFASASISNSAVSGARQYILSHQNGDGGWGYGIGVSSDSNTTAAAIAALAASGGVPGGAVGYLNQSQDSSGGYGYTPGDAADGASTAWVMWGLRAANQSIPQEATDFLSSLQTSGGLFKWKPSDNSGSVSITADAVIALSGHTLPIRTVSSPNPAPTPTPGPTPTPVPTPTPLPHGRTINNLTPNSGSAGTIITVVGNNLTDVWRGTTTLQFFDRNNARYTYLGSSEENQTVSHFTIPNLPAGNYTVKSGPNLNDVSNAVAFTVTGNNVPTPAPSPAPNPIPTTPNSNLADHCLVPIFNTNFAFPPEGGKIVQKDGQMYFARTYLNGCGDSGSPISHPFPLPAPIPAPAPAPVPAPSPSVSLSIRYNQTVIFNASVNYSTSSTALSLLQNAGQNNGFSVQTRSTSLGTYVSGINGYSASGANGWQYAINGSVPSVGADQSPVQAGDRIQWFYGAPGTSPY